MQCSQKPEHSQFSHRLADKDRRISDLQLGIRSAEDREASKESKIRGKFRAKTVEHLASKPTSSSSGDQESIGGAGAEDKFFDVTRGGQAARAISTLRTCKRDTLNSRPFKASRGRLMINTLDFDWPRAVETHESPC
jgi:hypothetical protein